MLILQVLFEVSLVDCLVAQWASSLDLSSCTCVDGEGSGDLTHARVVVGLDVTVELVQGVTLILASLWDSVIELTLQAGEVGSLF